MDDYERLSEVYAGVRRKNYARSLRALGVYILSPGGSSAGLSPQPSTPSAPTPLTSLHRALLQREQVCRLIEQGLANHASRLDPWQWQQVKDELRLFEPGSPAVKATVRQSIELTEATFRERGGSYGAWNVMEATRFERWAQELIAELDQYQRHSEVVQHSEAVSRG